MATHETIVQFKDSWTTSDNASSSSLGGHALSMWELIGTPAHGLPPTAPENPTNLTQGSVGQADAAAGKDKLLTSLYVAGLWLDGHLSLHDRLIHAGGFDATVSTPQLIGATGTGVSRHYVDGAGVNDIGNEIYLEIYQLIGTAQVHATVQYHNEFGVLHSTRAVLFGGTNYREPQRWIQCPLAAGDRGVRDVVSVTLDGSTGTAGNFGVVIVHRLLSFEMAQGSPEIWTGITEGDLVVMPGACLFWSWRARAGAASTTLALPLVIFAFAEK